MTNFRAYILSLATLSSVCVALPAVAPSMAFAQTAESSDAMVQQPVSTLYKALSKTQGAAGKAMTSQQRYDLLKPAVANSYDLPGILRKTLGGRFDRLDDAQKSALNAAFERFTIAHYVADFKPSANVVFSIDPTITDGVNGTRLVKTTVRGKDDAPDAGTVLTYMMADHKGDGWRIMDVLVGGSMSQVAIQRFDFLAQYKLGGAEHLVKTLNAKADKYMQER